VKGIDVVGTLLPCSIESNMEWKELILLAHYFLVV